MKITIFFLIFLVTSIPQAFSEELFITKSDADILFDGIWSFTTEWKRSTQELVLSDDKEFFAIRIAHDYDDVFLLLDVFGDTTKNRLGDRAIVCFDTLTDLGDRPKLDDYCFQISLDGNLITLTGDSNIAQSGFYKKIKNPEGVIAIGGISNEFDRYLKSPHVSYEFKIPINVIGASSSYGFYVGVFDAQTNKMVSWPNNLVEPNYPFIPSPDKWGILISPDKSLPEFSSSIIFSILIFSLLIFTIMAKSKFVKLYLN